VDPETQERPLSFVAAALWTLLVAMLIALASGILESAHPGARSDVVTISVCKLFIYSLVFFALLRVHEPESSIRQVLALRRPPLVLLGLGAAVGAGLSPLAQWISARIAVRYPPTPTPEESQAMERLLSSETSAKRIALVVAFVVIMPACDELFFRGALFTPLKRGRRADAVVLATAAYDVLMGGPSGPQLAWLLPTVLAFSWMRATTGSVLPSLLARMAFFAVQVLPLVVRRETVTAVVPLPASVSVGSGTLAVAGGVLAVVGLAGVAAVSRRSSRVLDARLEDG